MPRVRPGVALVLLGIVAGFELVACQLSQCVRHSDCGEALVCDAGFCAQSLPAVEMETEGGSSGGGADPGMAGGTGGALPVDPPPGEGEQDEDEDAGADDGDAEESAGSSGGPDGPQRDPESGQEPPPPPQRESETDA